MKYLVTTISMFIVIQSKAETKRYYCDQAAVQYAAEYYEKVEGSTEPMNHQAVFRWAIQQADKSVIESFNVQTESANYTSKMHVKLKRSQEGSEEVQCQVLEQYWVL